MDFFTQSLAERGAIRLNPVSVPGQLAEPKVRPVDPEWHCQRSGDCCTKITEVVMTKQEASSITFHAPPQIVLHFRPVDDKFVALKAEPCPLYAFKTCLVYAHRPFNCRRFACMRPDVKAEPFEMSGANMMDRVHTSKVARKMAQTIQRRAQRWARKMGWMDDGQPAS